jgi:hypothetical protein
MKSGLVTAANMLVFMGVIWPSTLLGLFFHSLIILLAIAVTRDEVALFFTYQYCRVSIQEEYSQLKESYVQAS